MLSRHELVWRKSSQACSIPFPYQSASSFLMRPMLPFRRTVSVRRSFLFFASFLAALSAHYLALVVLDAVNNTSFIVEPTIPSTNGSPGTKPRATKAAFSVGSMRAFAYTTTMHEWSEPNSVVDTLAILSAASVVCGSKCMQYNECIV